VYAYEHGIGNMKADQIEIKGTQIEEVLHPFAPHPTNVHEFDEYVTVHDENACFGCRAYMYMALANAKHQGKLKKNSGVQVVLGPKDHIPDEWIEAGELLFIGNCLSKWKHLGQFAEGCIPNGGPFMAAAMVGRVDAEALQELMSSMMESPLKK
jgi:hypothetical protein